MTFNYWHYIFFTISFIIFILGIRSALKQENPKLIIPMLITVTLIPLFLVVISTLLVDKYTKEVKISKLKSKRLLSLEKVVYTGIVKNTGAFEVGEATLEIKLVNQGHATGRVSGGNIFKPSSFFDLFSEGANVLYKPQTLTKEFVVAKNLKPGTAQSFRVYFNFPPYFRNVSVFTKVSAH